MAMREAAEAMAVILPLVLYFGFLGLVNIRRRPTVVSGRLDFVVVILAFLPLLYHPVRMVVSFGGPAWKGAVFAAVALVLWLLLPREFTSWVIYSISEATLTRRLEGILRREGVAFVRRGNRIECEPPAGTLVISNMPMLHNVTIYLQDGRETAFFERLGEALQEELSAVESRPSLSGHCFLAVAVTLLFAPLVYMIASPNGLYAWLRGWLSAG